MTNAEHDARRIIRSEVARLEAIRHGHPEWSHAVAYGPCRKPSITTGWK